MLSSLLAPIFAWALEPKQKAEPPPVFDEADSPDQAAFAPEVSIFDPTQLTRKTDDDVPPLAQAAAHLLLMEAFWTWKDKVTTGETGTKLLGLFSYGDDHLQWDDEKRSRQLFSALVEVALPRFYRWWSAAHQRLPRGEDVELPESLLPPLDVMIIWHGYMLQPGLYADDCARLGVPRMCRISFPWQAIFNAIDLETLNYTIPQSAREFWDSISEEPVDLITQLTTANRDLVYYNIHCPYCETTKKAPVLTTLQTDNINLGFELQCDCGCKPSVDALYRDLLRVRQSGEMCLRGTYLSRSLGDALRSLAGSMSEAELASNRNPDQFVHAIHAAAARSNTPGWAVERMLDLYIPTSPVTKAASSHYASVLRSFRFVEKMHELSWLRSPALYSVAHSSSPPEGVVGTLPRGQQKYRDFLKLVRQADSASVTPTTDIDLFWHTHQLSPGPYRQCCIRHVGRFMNHDDKVAEESLTQSFDNTQELYIQQFGGEYDGCLCWPCEMERNDRDAAGKGGPSVTKERQDWNRRVCVVFWQEVESRRQENRRGLDRTSLDKVLARGPQLAA